MTTDLPISHMQEDLMLNPVLASPQAPMIVLDTETTGLDYKTEAIIEVAAVKLLPQSDGSYALGDTFHTLVNPEKAIRSSSQKVHGIAQSEVEQAPLMKDVLPQLLDFFGENGVLVAHNALFDYSFINQAYRKYISHAKQDRWPVLRIDTYDMYRKLYPEDPSHGLASLLKRFDLPQEVSHRAMDDAMNLAKAYPQLRKLYVQQHQWQLLQIQHNMPYIMERYQRVQHTVQLLQAELNDTKELLKLYFQEGGEPLTLANRERISWGYKRHYTYDEKALWAVLEEAGLLDKFAKINTKTVDRWLASRRFDADIQEAVWNTRSAMRETRVLDTEQPQKD